MEKSRIDIKILYIIIYIRCIKSLLFLALTDYGIGLLYCIHTILYYTILVKVIHLRINNMGLWVLGHSVTYSDSTGSRRQKMTISQ